MSFTTLPEPLFAFLLLPAALVLDRLFGEPAPKWHPVCAMGRSAVFWERVLRRACPRSLRLAGSLAWAAMQACFALPAFLAIAGLEALAGMPAALAAAACTIWLCLAPRCLAEHALAVQRPLARGETDLARRMLGRMVGRRTDLLDEAGVARACVESVAENCTDGVTATLFWAAAGLVLAGPAGAAGLALVHRTANTLDAMWGRLDATYRDFGRTAARLDDVLNFLPARLTLPCIALAACFVPGCRAGAALRVGLAHHDRHESPNSAWSEAAFAGALDLRLGGPATYADRLVPHPWLGTGSDRATYVHIHLAVRLMQASVLCLALLLSALLALAAGLA